MFKSYRQITIGRFYSTPNDPKATTEPSTTDAESDIVHLNDRDDVWIPEYPTRVDEPLEKRRQRYSNVFYLPKKKQTNFRVFVF